MPPGNVRVGKLAKTSNRAAVPAIASAMTLPAKFLGGFSGVVVDLHGYPSFFVYASLIGVPAVVLVLCLSRLANPDREPQAEVKSPVL